VFAWDFLVPGQAHVVLVMADDRLAHAVGRVEPFLGNGNKRVVATASCVDGKVASRGLHVLARAPNAFGAILVEQVLTRCLHGMLHCHNLGAVIAVKRESVLVVDGVYLHRRAVGLHKFLHSIMRLVVLLLTILCLRDRKF